MRLTVLGKLILFILVVGAAIGGWRWWNQRQSESGRGGQTWTGASSTTGGDSSGSPGGSSGGVSIPFVITAAKKDWVQEQVDRFNKAHSDQWQITTTAVPSREAMHAILEGQQKPVLWSPGSPIWPTRLAEVWKGQNRGSAILDMNDPNGYRVFLRSPLVFLTTTDKLKFLAPLLGGKDPWEAIRQLSLGKKTTPWGSFRFSHADPLTSSSGIMTVGLILADYAQRTGQSGVVDKVAETPGFINYLKELEAKLVYDDPAQKGTTVLTKAFIDDPKRYDFITAYESAALEAASSHPNLAVIYPNPTVVSEHAVSLLAADWVTPRQKEGAAAFLTFLGSPDSLQAGLKYHFRPVNSASSLSLAPEITAHQAQGFQQTYSTVELPPYAALNSAAFVWRIHVAYKPPTAQEKM